MFVIVIASSSISLIAHNYLDHKFEIGYPLFAEPLLVITGIVLRLLSFTVIPWSQSYKALA